MTVVHTGTTGDRKILIMGAKGPETKNDCAGEDQQQFTKQTGMPALSQLQTARSDTRRVSYNKQFIFCLVIHAACCLLWIPFRSHTA
jgi:hypothetical protein